MRTKNTEHQENKSVKTLKGQLFGAVAMMLVAAIALGTSTYAWFINNSTVEVENMQLTVSTSTSMTVAVGKTDNTYTGYKTVVTNQDISGVGAAAGADVADWAKMFENPLDPASVTTASLITGTPKYFQSLGTVDNNMLTTFKELAIGSTDTDVGQGPVKRIPLRFLSSTDLEVYFGAADLENLANLVTQAVESNADSAAQAAAIRTALRIAIVPKATAKFAGPIAPVVFQFDDGTGAVAGAINNTDYNGQTAAVDETAGTYAAIASIETGENANKGKVTGVGELKATLPQAKDNGYVAVVAAGATGAAATVTKPTTSPTPLFELAASEARDVDVYIWLEGTDKDCVSVLSAYQFNLRLPFAGVIKGGA